MTFQLSREEGRRQRLSLVGKAKRIVVKVGSAVLTGADGLDFPVVENLARDLHALRASGHQVILVSSGAVAAGRKKLGLGSRPLTLREKQATAAAGQSSLMLAYESIFDRLGQKVAQVLLTHDDLANRDRYLNVRNTIFTLLEWGVLPILNENDTVSVKELRFGDNDTLGAMITTLIEADLFICLTDVAGLHTGNPSSDPEARLVTTVATVNAQVEAMVASNARGALGTGGMQSKIKAAKMVAAKGGSSFIGSGRQPGIIAALFRGEEIGTFFLPQAEKMASWKHWIAYTLRPKGFLLLDDGACQALRQRGKSLLPSGIVAIRGKFKPGDPVHCLDLQERPIAAGLVSYSSEDVAKILGVRTAEIEQRLGFIDGEEVIHRDNLVML